MGKRGPRPKPTRLKELAGNPGKRALNKREPKPQLLPGAPPAPPHVVGPAELEWNRVAGELYRLKLLSVVDIAALEAYCVSYGEWRLALENLERDGYVVQYKNEDGTLQGEQVSPWLKLARDAQTKMRQFASEFGLTPATRSSVTVPEGGQRTPAEAPPKKKRATRKKRATKKRTSRKKKTEPLDFQAFAKKRRGT